MMPKKPVTPFTRYSTPASLAVVLVEFMSPLSSYLFLYLRYGPPSPARSRPGSDTASVILLANSISRKLEFSRRFYPLKATKPRAIGMSQEATLVPPYDGPLGRNPATLW